LKNPSQKRAGGVAEGVDPEFNPKKRQLKALPETHRPVCLSALPHHPETEQHKLSEICL
jgi:hypothetical protein